MGSNGETSARGKPEFRSPYTARSVAKTRHAPRNCLCNFAESGATRVVNWAPFMDKRDGAGEITLLLADWSHGKPGALEQLMPLVYDQLHRLAESLMRNERPDHTLQGTALVNEMFGQLLKLRKVALADRAHFYTFSARLMRRLLVDYARQFRAAKRGSALSRVPLEAELAWIHPTQEGSIDLSRALDELQDLDPEKARAVELRYFLGCTVEEAAALLSVSPSTIDRDIRFSLAWLHDRLHPPS
jgi:RNA polymerase sigma factor (TIGR02999 family)